MKKLTMLQYILCVLLVTGVSMSSGATTRGDTPVEEEQEQRFTVQPEDVTMETGDLLKLRCSVTNTDMRGRCQWTRDGLGLGTDPELPGYPRYTMEVTEDGDCNLSIFPVLVEDEAAWQCQVVGSVVSRTAEVRVNSRPGVPYIRQARTRDILDVVEAAQVALECETSGAKPGAEVEWRDQQGRLLVNNMLETVTRNQRTNTFRTVSSIQLTPTENMEVTCGASNEAFPDPRMSRTLKLRLNYRPRLSLNVTEDTRLSAGQDLTIKCSSQAFPEVNTFTWFINDNEVLKDVNTDSISLGNISEDLDRAVIRCRAENRVGTSEVTTVLNVEFQPRIVTEPESVTAKLGEEVTFRCGAVGNPAPQYVWVRRRGEDERIVGVSEQLRVTAAPDTEAEYRCKVVVAGQQLVSRAASLDIVRAPVVSVAEEKLARPGDDVILQCRVRSLDPFTQITWTKDGSLIKDTLRTRQLRLDPDHVDLVIYNVAEEDFVKYGCFAENEVGQDYATVELLRVHDRSVMTTTFPLLAAAATLVFTVYSVWSSRHNILARLRDLRHPRPELPVVQRDILAPLPAAARGADTPIYRGNDPAVFEILLNNGMDEKEYLNLSEEYFDKIPSG